MERAETEEKGRCHLRHHVAQHRGHFL